jgi:hypothetical protein
MGDLAIPEPNNEHTSVPTNGQALPLPGETASAPTNGNGAAPNPFDPAVLRKRRTGSTEVKKTKPSVAEGKPEPDCWYRVNPDPEYIVPADILQVKQAVKGKDGKQSSGARRTMTCAHHLVVHPPLDQSG